MFLFILSNSTRTDRPDFIWTYLNQIWPAFLPPDTSRHFVYMQYCLWEMQKREFFPKKPVSQCSAAIIVLLRLTNYTNHTLKTAFGKYLTTNGFCNSSPLFSIIEHSCWPVVKHNFMKLPVYLYCICDFQLGWNGMKHMHIVRVCFIANIYQHLKAKIASVCDQHE